MQPVTDQNLLYPPFREKLRSSIREFQNRYPGILVGIGETYRSRQLQRHYFQTGASRTTQGTHGLGLAADVHVSAKYYPTLRKIFLKNGLYLLGNWDLGHVQYIPVSDQATVWKAVADVCITTNVPGQIRSGPVRSESQLSTVSPFLIIGAVGAGIALVVNLLDDTEDYE